jgi:hypothetical protein
MRNGDYIDAILPVAGILGEACCSTCFLVTGVWRRLPLTTLFLLFAVTSETAGYVVFAFASYETYWKTYLATSFGLSLCEIALMWELSFRSREVLQSTLRRRLNISYCILATSIALVSSVVSYSIHYRGLEPDVAVLLHFDTAFAVCRTLVFLSIIVFENIAKMDLEDIAVVTTICFALSSVIDLLAEIAQEIAVFSNHQFQGFQLIERIRSAIWAAILLSLALRVFHRMTSRSSITATEASINIRSEVCMMEK